MRRGRSRSCRRDRLGERDVLALATGATASVGGERVANTVSMSWASFPGSSACAKSPNRSIHIPTTEAMMIKRSVFTTVCVVLCAFMTFPLQFWIVFWPLQGKSETNGKACQLDWIDGQRGFTA